MKQEQRIKKKKKKKHAQTKDQTADTVPLQNWLVNLASILQNETKKHSDLIQFG